jgi:deoxyhypusine monooxygenase
MAFVTPPLPDLLSTLNDLSRPIAARMRAIFYLRTLGGSENVRALCGALRRTDGTALFRHEIAYVLGQMQDATAVPDLLAVLRDVSDDTVVRHEVRFFSRWRAPPPRGTRPASTTH